MKPLALSSRPKIFLTFQALALAAGNIVGWTTIFREVETFCDAQGGGLWHLTEFSGTATANPLASPCFWGSVVFLVALAWTLSIIFEADKQKVTSHVRKMWWLLMGGTLFALVNNVPLFYRFYTQPAGTATSCSGDGIMSNPFLTSCFLGFSAFLLAFMFATGAKYALRQREPEN